MKIVDTARRAAVTARTSGPRFSTVSTGSAIFFDILLSRPVPARHTTPYSMKQSHRVHVHPLRLRIWRLGWETDEGGQNQWQSAINTQQRK